MDNYLTIEDVRKRILQQVGELGSQSAVAAKFGVSPVYISGVLKGNRAPGPGILAGLGLQQVLVYRPH